MMPEELAEKLKWKLAKILAKYEIIQKTRDVSKLAKNSVMLKW